MTWLRRRRCSTFTATGASFRPSHRSPRWVCCSCSTASTGEPVYGMEERPVPQTAVPGEVTAKTQPFPLKPPPLAKNTFRLEEMYDRSPEHARFCRELFESNQMTIGPPYTPLPLEGNALFFPSTLGGGNWGGVSVDPVAGPVVRQRHERGAVGPHGEARLGVHRGLPPTDPTRGSGIARRAIPCQNPPFGELIAVDLVQRRYRVAIRTGQDRGARSDRRARHGDAQPRREHRDRGRSRFHRGDERFPLPGIRFEDGESCFGRRSWRRAGTPARSPTWDATDGNTWR